MVATFHLISSGELNRRRLGDKDLGHALENKKCTENFLTISRKETIMV
jgi:hypothetical protein